MSKYYDRIKIQRSYRPAIDTSVFSLQSLVRATEEMRFADMGMDYQQQVLIVSRYTKDVVLDMFRPAYERRLDKQKRLRTSSIRF